MLLFEKFSYIFTRYRYNSNVILNGNDMLIGDDFTRNRYNPHVVLDDNDMLIENVFPMN